VGRSSRYILRGYDGGLPPHPRPEVEGVFALNGLRFQLEFRGTRAGVAGSLRSVAIDVTSTGSTSCRVTVKSASDPSVAGTFSLPRTDAETLRADLEARHEEIRRGRALRARVEAGEWWLDPAFFARLGRAGTVSVTGVRYLGGWSGATEPSGPRHSRILDLGPDGVSLRGFRRSFTIPWLSVTGLEVAARPARRGVEADEGVSQLGVELAAPRQGQEPERALFETSELSVDELRQKVASITNRIKSAASPTTTPNG
jgi:hypothetical protein